jgi:hypothetical protein
MRHAMIFVPPQYHDISEHQLFACVLHSPYQQPAHGLRMHQNIFRHFVMNNPSKRKRLFVSMHIALWDLAYKTSNVVTKHQLF